VALLGWSIGGIIAHEMAVQLRAGGDDVGFVALLDAYPSDRWRGMAEPADGAALEALLLIAGEESAHVPRPLTREAVIGLLRERRHPLGELSDASLAGVVRVVESNNRLVRRFHHSRLDAPVVFFRAAEEHGPGGPSPSEWAPYVSGPFDVHDIAVRHAHLTGAEAVERMAPIVNAHLLRT
jgi:enterobactin synthetase component F